MTIDVGGPINAPGPSVTVGGITLSELRQRLRIELSSYAANTLILNTGPDIERQFINDGIGQLYPYDFQIINRSIPIVGAQEVYFLPIEVEHVFTVSVAQKDINEPSVHLSRLPHHDAWIFESSVIDASTVLLEDGITTWTDSTQKALTVDIHLLGTTQVVPNYSRYLIVRYAKRWPSLVQEIDSIDPTPSRIQAVIYFACAQFFSSQQEVNSESVRYNNYINLSNQFEKKAMMQLVRDPKQLYFL